MKKTYQEEKTYYFEQDYPQYSTKKGDQFCTTYLTATSTNIQENEDARYALVEEIDHSSKTHVPAHPSRCSKSVRIPRIRGIMNLSNEARDFIKQSAFSEERKNISFFRLKVNGVDAIQVNSQGADSQDEEEAKYNFVYKEIIILNQFFFGTISTILV